jgi:SAM-dependent methyltransferase
VARPCQPSYTVMYDAEPHIAEIYDRTETTAADVDLIRALVGGRGPLRILEPFCGTGRILIPLALDGHELVGLDRARGMLDRAQAKIGRLSEGVQRRIALLETDVTREPWPSGFDLVILGGNCLYELATPEEQAGCIRSAAASLRAGGYVYVDNDHMEGDLDEAWRRPGVSRGFPSGTCADGTLVETTTETVWYDAPRRLVRLRRCTKVTLPGGRIIEKEHVQQKHPVSIGEVRTWLATCGFTVERAYGDRARTPYRATSERAIFWARKG